jgi:hypothetical protein
MQQKTVASTSTEKLEVPKWPLGVVGCLPKIQRKGAIPKVIIAIYYETTQKQLTSSVQEKVIHS